MYRELFKSSRVLVLSMLALLACHSCSATPVRSIKGKSVDVIFDGGTPGFCINMCDMIKDICNDPDKPVCLFVEKPGCAYRCEKSSAASSVTNILSGSAMPLSSPDIMPMVSDIPNQRRSNRAGTSSRRSDRAGANPRRRERAGSRSRPMARR